MCKHSSFFIYSLCHFEESIILKEWNIVRENSIIELLYTTRKYMEESTNESSYI